MTYSIVARDPDTGELGVAVQSHYFSVGGICPWVRPGIGAIASQAMAEPSYGPLGLDLLAGGKSPKDALRALTTADPGSASRQVAMVDATGRVAAHTGASTIAAAGHRTGAGYSVQANMMLKDTVWDAMANAFEATTGPLAERMLATFRAAEAEGGDIRGRQSATLLIAKGEPGPPTWSLPVVNLRVEDHPDPVAEMTRLLDLHRAYGRLGEADELIRAGDIGAIRAEHEKFMELSPGNPEMAFWLGVSLANGGKFDEARTVLELSYAVSPHWAELLKRLPAAGLLSCTDEQLARLTAEVSSSGR